ncbi:MAG TPA: PrsW family glutamic-type intramembrane protease [Pyrinomonadaceae bacterium]|nr:PrsW family glutamic-type intramembrane protease [Pyrinomonadaceae bacterium]HMP64861.1 PrsW family glutamic-type intramembrane protease [Pyrinomonadaceae bacterium]
MKLTLRITSGGLAGREFELETGFLTIGRSENCSVRFDPVGERIASKQHAFIEATPDGFFIQDNQSTNGTLVNGNKIDRQKLVSGDTVQFGKNGVTASVAIEGDYSASPPDIYRQQEMDNFQAAAASVPTGVFQSMANIGLGGVEAVPPPPPPPATSAIQIVRYIFVAAAYFFLIIGVPLVALVLFSQVGVVFAAMAAVIAFVPVVLYLTPLFWLDRFDPEPLWLLFLTFLWGGVAAVLASIILNTLLAGIVFEMTGVPQLADLAGAVIAAPVFEEATKGIWLLILLMLFRRHFDDVLDGIVFAGVVALGFATVENVLYYGRGLGSAVYQFGFTYEAISDFFLLFSLRGILSPWAHVTFTAMIGIGCGISRESHNWIVRIGAPMAGYALAVLLHAIWNGMGIVVTLAIISFGLDPVCDFFGLGGPMISLCGFFALYIVFEIPFFIIFISFAFWLTRRQRRILDEMLALDIARGLITQEDLDRTCKFFKSGFWILGGMGSGKAIARYRFTRAISKLGLSYWHIHRATKAQGHTASFQQNPLLRDEVIRWRDKV